MVGGGAVVVVGTAVVGGTVVGGFTGVSGNGAVATVVVGIVGGAVGSGVGVLGGGTVTGVRATGRTVVVGATELEGTSAEVGGASVVSEGAAEVVVAVVAVPLRSNVVVVTGAPRAASTVA